MCIFMQQINKQRRCDIGWTMSQRKSDSEEQPEGLNLGCDVLLFGELVTNSPEADG